MVRLSALKSNLEPSLDLFADVVLNPAFPEPDFRRQQKQQLAAIQREKATPISMGLRVFPALLYGKSHAYGLPLTGSGSETGVSTLTREDLVKFHGTWFKPNHATLIVVGDTTLPEITPLLEKRMAGWKRGEVPRKNIGTVELPSQSVVYLMDKPGALQSEIMAGHVAPPRNNPDEIAIEAMNNVLGGNFSARINMNLREDKHWSYGATSFFFDARGQRPFMVFAPVQTDKTKESLLEIDKELKGIVSAKPATPDELARVKASETLKLPGSQETIDAVGGSIAELVQFGLPDDYYETYAAKVRALVPADVESAAKRVIQPEHLVWVVVGDRSKIEAGIRDLGIGEIKLLDPDGRPL